MKKPGIIAISIGKCKTIEDVVASMFRVKHREGRDVDCIFNNVYLSTVGYYNAQDVINDYLSVYGSKITDYRDEFEKRALKERSRLLRHFPDLNFEDSEEVVRWISNIIKYADYIDANDTMNIAKALEIKGYQSVSKDFQNRINEIYNTDEQFVMLCQDKYIVEQYIIGRYIGGIKLLGNMPPLVSHFTNIYHQRFKQDFIDSVYTKK